MEKRELIPVIVAIVIGASALGLGVYSYITLGGQVSTVDENLNFDSSEARGLIRDLQSSIASLQASITVNQENGTAASQQIKLIKARLDNVSSQLNASDVSNSENLQQISSQLQNISDTIQVLSGKVDAFNPQLPNTTLIIVENYYDSSSNTFTFIVENTQDTLIYVQLVGNMYSLNCTLDGLAGTYYSEIYAFKSGENTVTTLDLGLGSYFSCPIPFINRVTVNFIIAPDIAVSPTYTFNVVPNMEIP